MPDPRSLVAALAALTAAAVPPAAAPAAVETRVGGTGALTITWQGDPARGCAEAGVCDVRGSVTRTVVDPLDDGESVGSDPAPGQVDGVSVSVLEPLVRVERGPPGAPAGICADAAADDVGQLSLGPPAFERRPRTLVLTPELGGPIGEVLGSGRCAGPRPADVLPALPSVPVERLRATGRSRVDLSGRRTFTAGPFTGAVESSVVLDVRRRRVTDPDAFSLSEPRTPEESGLTRRRVAVLSARYTVEALSGTLAATLTPGLEPACRLLDACGLSGTVSLTPAPLARRRPVLEVRAEQPLRRGRRAPTPARLIAGLAAGRGRVSLESLVDATLSARTAADLARAGAPACRDALAVELPNLVASSTAGGRLRLALGSEQFGESGDALRTRCPGPGRAQLFGRGSLAAGTVPVAALGRRSFTVTLTPPAARPSPFPTRLGGAITVRLRRASSRVRAESTFSPIGGGR